jgi:N-acyl-D-amino-acid deacylase
LRHEDATPEDIAEMCALTREAMRAGAIGFSSSRILEHRSSNGSTAPGTFATEDEMVSLAKAMGESGHGVFQVIPAGSVGAAVLEDIGPERRLEEHRLMEKIVEAAARPLTYSLTQYNSDPGNFEMSLEASTRAFERGLPIYPQFAARGIGLVSALDGYHVFLMKPSYNAIAHLPLSERVTAMRDPERRQAILGEADFEDDFADQPPVLGMLRRMHVNLPRNYVPETPLDYEPGADRLVSALASAQGKTPHEFIYDHEGEVLESFVTKKWDKSAAPTFVKKALKQHGRPEKIITDGLRSYPAAMHNLGNLDRCEMGRFQTGQQHISRDG